MQVHDVGMDVTGPRGGMLWLFVTRGVDQRWTKSLHELRGRDTAR